MRYHHRHRKYRQYDPDLKKYVFVEYQKLFELPPSDDGPDKEENRKATIDKKKKRPRD
jgi:hypothetical protein